MAKIAYPFQPALLDSLPEELAELFRGLELTLLQEICSRLNLADQLNEVTVDAIRALRSHGIDLKDIEKAIRDVTGISQKKLDKLLDDVVERNQAYYRELITLAKVTEPQTLVDQADIDAIKAQCQREFGNITRSMGFLVDNGRTMLPPAKAYQHCLDMAELKISSGAVSYNEAIRQAVRELADSGLKTVDYASGHTDSVDVAVRRAVMSGVNRLNSQYREQSMDYLDTDLVEISAHLGARNIPGPNGWEAHTEWQGKVFRWKGHGKQAEEPRREPQEPQDVTEEYQRTATPGIGKITYSDGFNKDEFPNETGTAKWIHRTFGGDIAILKDVNQQNVKTPDYIWQGKYWDLKNISTEKAANSAIRHGLQQIRENPGGIILNLGDMDLSEQQLKAVIAKRMQWNRISSQIDILAVAKENLLFVLRYK